MKKSLLLLVLFCATGMMRAQFPCVDGNANGYPCRNMDLLAFVPTESMGGDANSNTNDIWGWVSPVTGKEYALVGCSYGTAFLDISIPTNPLYLGVLPTHSVNSLWRDLETYNNYCFIVSEASQHGLQVFDLLQLDNVTNAPVTFEETTHYDGFSNCHTLTINQATGYAYCVGTNTFSGGLHIVDISNPLAPFLAGGYGQGGYTHDCYVWLYDGPDPDYQNKEIVFGCNENDLLLIDVTDKSDCQALGSYDYNGQAPVGYIHQGWVTKDKSHFLIDDELDEINIGNDQLPYGTRTHMFDITDLDNVGYQGFYESTNTSIDHNLYVLDQFVYESNYRSGVRVLDAIKVDDGTLSEVGYFDLYPSNDFAQFSGTWSNYPYLPSGVNIATSMYSGFFILKPTLIVLAQDDWTLCGTNEIILDVQVNANLMFPLTFAVEGLGSVSVSADPLATTGNASVTISGLNELASGTYSPILALQSSTGQQYEVPFSLVFSSGLANAPALLNVPDNSLVSNTAISTLFDWEELSNADSYTFQVASDANFTSIIETQVTTGPSFLLTYDLPDGVYYWRVRASNGCGNGEWSEVFQFTILFVEVDENQLQRPSIFPIPSSDELNIVNMSVIESVQITDLSGRVISISGPVMSNQMKLDITDLDSGTYLITVNKVTSKFIKY